MSLFELVAIVHSFISLALIWYMWCRLFPQYRLDKFRQEMFKVRNELFLFAASGAISFDDPAYRLLRRSMNGYLRYAHRMTFYQICITLLEWRFTSDRPNLAWLRSWNQALREIRDPVVRQQMADFHRRSTNLAIRFVVTSSILLRIAVLISASGVLVHENIGSLHQALKKAAHATLARVVDLRLLEADAARSAA